MGLLDEIKKRLSITGEYQDELLLGLIDDVKQYLISAGVKQSVVNSSKSIGCISRGVFDLWTKEAFSELFNQRVIQLTFEDEAEEGDFIPNKSENETIPDEDIPNEDIPNEGDTPDDNITDGGSGDDNLDGDITDGV